MKVVKRCNEGAKKMEQTEQVINIEHKLIFNKIKVSIESLTEFSVACEIFKLNYDVCFRKYR